MAAHGPSQKEKILLQLNIMAKYSTYSDMNIGLQKYPFQI